jgi:hypothetical protein
MRKGEIWNVMRSFDYKATRQVENFQRNAHRLIRGFGYDKSQSKFSIDRNSVGSSLCLKNRIILLFIVYILFLGNPVFAAVYPKEPIPMAGFRLGWRLEILIISGICLLAVFVWILTHSIPISGEVISMILLMPIIEEYIFRYLLMYLFLLGGNANPGLNQEIGINELVRAFIIVGVIFGILHLLLRWLITSSLITAPGGLQVGEGLFIGMLNGLIFLNFIFVFEIGLLITMFYVWVAHILINMVLVIYNLFVNLVLGGSFLAHLIPRLLLAVIAILWFWCGWKYQTIGTEIF